MAEFYRKKKKICQMCAGKSVDYKDVMIINKYINEKGVDIIFRYSDQYKLAERYLKKQNDVV